MTEQPKNYNFKRSATISQLARKNLEMIKQAETYYNETGSETIRKMIDRVAGCSVGSLYKIGEEVEYITSLTCKHKGCNICNYNRQKQIRRKYLIFLERNQELFSILDKKGREKIIIPEIFDERKHEYLESLHYDLMHLTLTVPHTKELGFRGNKYYFKDIEKLFKNLRRQKFFVENVFGGEFGIEVTNGDNGLNIHIHSLLMVHRFKQNRDILHRQIFLAWNKLTIDNDRERKPISKYRAEKIKKGNDLFTDDDIKQIDSRGATLMGLENIFVKDENGNKIRALTPEARRNAVVETVSYHFKPKMFETDDGVFDFDLIDKVLTHSKGVRFYDKFGVFRQSKVLALKNNEVDDFKEANEVKESDIRRGRFYKVNPRRVYHDFTNEQIKIHQTTLKDSKEIPAINTLQAIELLRNV